MNSRLFYLAGPFSLPSLFHVWHCATAVIRVFHGRGITCLAPAVRPYDGRRTIVLTGCWTEPRVNFGESEFKEAEGVQTLPKGLEGMGQKESGSFWIF